RRAARRDRARARRHRGHRRAGRRRRSHRMSELMDARSNGAAPDRTAPDAEPRDPPNDEAVDILIVDDRPENVLALEALLEPFGQRLVSAHSGDEALRHLLVRDVALILLDVQMPG